MVLISEDGLLFFSKICELISEHDIVYSFTYITSAPSLLTFNKCMCMNT